MGSAAALPARPLRRRDREHQDLRRRHAAHALPGARRAPAARARVSAGRRGPHALPRALPRGLRGRPVALAAVQGRQQRRRARRHRVLPAAVLRQRRRRSPTTCRDDAVVALHGDVHDGGRSGSGTTPSRATGCCAATRRGRCCRRARSFLPPDEFSGALKTFARVELPAPQRAPRLAPDAPAVPLPRVAGRPPRRRSARRAEAPRSRRRTRACWSAPKAPAAARRCSSTSPSTGSSVPRRRRLRVVRRRATRAARWSPRRCTPASRGRDGAARVRHRSRALRRTRAPRASATPARRSNVDAMLRDLSEVRIGDPVVHEQHGIGRYLGLVHARPRRRRRPSSSSSSTRTARSSTCRCRACT